MMFRTQRHQVVKHYLIQWYKLDSNFGSLDSVEEVKMKILYASLKSLNEDELGFMARKYRKKDRPTDKDAAVLEGMTFKDYRDKRLQIETELKHFILDNKERFEDEFRIAIDQTYSRRRATPQ